MRQISWRAKARSVTSVAISLTVEPICMHNDCNAIIMHAFSNDRGYMTMASITIRNLEDNVKTRLRVRAAEHSRSMEEEARIILRDAVSNQKPGLQNLAQFTRECFGSLGGVELELPPRNPMREPPDFS